jgi:hypothetical protein
MTVFYDFHFLLVGERKKEAKDRPLFFKACEAGVLVLGPLPPYLPDVINFLFLAWWCGRFCLFSKITGSNTSPHGIHRIP